MKKIRCGLYTSIHHESCAKVLKSLFDRMIRWGFSIQFSGTPPLPERNAMWETKWAAEVYSSGMFKGTRAEQRAWLTQSYCTDTRLKWQMDRQQGFWKRLEEGFNRLKKKLKCHNLKFDKKSLIKSAGMACLQMKLKFGQGEIKCLQGYQWSKKLH